MPYQVSEIIKNKSSRPSSGRFDFSIVDATTGIGRVLLTLSYKTRPEAEEARLAAEEMTKKAVSAQ